MKSDVPLMRFSGSVIIPGIIGDPGIYSDTTEGVNNTNIIPHYKSIKRVIILHVFEPFILQSAA